MFNDLREREGERERETGLQLYRDWVLWDHSDILLFLQVTG